MARSRNYKRVNVQTKDIGDAGSQIRFLKVGMLDPQIKGCWLSGVKISFIINEGDQDNAGVIFYASTEEEQGSWSDDKVITAAACSGYGGNCYLKINRYINTDTEDTSGAMGPVYLWAESTDTTLVDNIELRLVTETWGRNLGTQEL